MTKYTKPYPTIGDLIKDKDYDYVSYRITMPPDKGFPEKDIFAGCFSAQNGEIISLDGDTYSKDEKVLASEEWSLPEEDIKTGFTVIV